MSGLRSYVINSSWLRKKAKTVQYYRTIFASLRKILRHHPRLPRSDGKDRLKGAQSRLRNQSNWRSLQLALQATKR
ncbi:hypothetical protein K443DRAFT_677991 [Laccaria amethystina LaAM-08-1]|uniref:Uncharacterized protein n=1 Tax=Laccaria amethystina LaAM-08-1 TaxID=1095629 RepID=A0A0C9XAU6_9AGAR|nr:hypothetical protein K443DRAFT_677991 [Laccaria amethystina LaAM-08-1]